MRERGACAAVVVFGLLGPCRADLILDDFETSTLGVLPDNWNDFATLVPGGGGPFPSTVTIDTTGPDGQPTRAAQIVRAVSTSQGIHADLTPADRITMSLDARVDAFDDETVVVRSWPLAFGFFQQTGAAIDPNRLPQAVVAIDTSTRRWLLYVQRSENQADNVLFFLSATRVVEGQWYHASIDVDALSGQIRSLVTDASGAVIIDSTRTIPQWKPQWARYDIAAAFDGEYGVNSTLGNLTTLDNIAITPAPGAMAMGLSVLCLGRRRR
ncbi:MAG: hypothetical protein H6811_08185 [Phycisphaeraceae bacterium]|nr:hypothetical protein [Phycisphaeraceae bacterium]